MSAADLPGANAGQHRAGAARSLDGVARPSGEAARPSGGVAGPQVVTVGETMAMMRTGAVGSLAHLPSVDISLGGAESNLAIGLRRLGVPVAWISRVGDDPLGTRVTREIRAEGVEIHCPADPERPTGLMIKSRPSSTTTRVDYYRAGSAAAALAPADLPSGLIEGAQVLHISGITPLLSPSAAETVTAAVGRAAAAGVLISLDINYRSRLGAREQLAELLVGVADRADVIFGGPEELSILAPGIAEDDHEGLLAAVSHDAGGEVVAKLGPDGAAALAGHEYVTSPGHRVAAVDTVGAGDAFVAGYLSALLEGVDVPGRLARANACGAVACTTPGDWESAPRREDLEALLAGGDADPVAR